MTDGLQLHPASFADPAGAVFLSRERGTVLRGIRRDFAPFYRGLLDRPLIQSRLGKEIVDTEVSSVDLDAFPLTLEHRWITPVSFASEWPSVMLRDAADLTLALCEALNGERLTLQDASTSNMVFDGARPVLVDFTSIVPQDANMIWEAYGQFCRHFLYPLALAECGRGRCARLLLGSSADGVVEDDLLSLLPASAWIRMPWLFAKVRWPLLLLRLLRSAGLEDRALRLAIGMHPSQAARRSFFTGLRRLVQGVSVRPRSSAWSEYHSESCGEEGGSAAGIKRAAVTRILAECRPATLVDLGCNGGEYSLVAARSGTRVTAIDSDEACVARVYSSARSEGLPILPLVVDVAQPGSSRAWVEVETPEPGERFKAEMTLALALVHHLAITCRLSFARIVRTLASYSRTWLLTEFVPLEDSKVRQLLRTSRRDMSWYTLDAFVSALAREYARVEVMRSSPSGRSLVLCRR